MSVIPGSTWKITGVGMLILGTLFILPHGDLVASGEVPYFLIGLAVMNLGYLLASRSHGTSPLLYWSVAVGLRLMLLGMSPGDDIFRYLWEGTILVKGFNPYLHAPDAMELAALRDSLWPKIGHPHISAIYPPLAQITFAFLAFLKTGIIGMKLFLGLADIATCGLLATRFGPHKAKLYAWNPLALYCFAGGGHYDSLFLLALVGAWIAWESAPRRVALAISLAGCAVAFKWMAAPLVAWMLWHVWKRQGFRHAVFGGIIGVLPFVSSWLLVCVWTGEWSTRLVPMDFARYARSAELIPAICDALYGDSLHNEIFLLPLSIAWIVAIIRCRHFAGAAEWCFFAAFILSPMMHAWYFTWLLPFAVLTRNPGTVALNITGCLYFIMCHRISLGEVWTLCWWERALVWLPFITGFLWSKFRKTSPLPLPQ